ncbi:STAS domain-containing protein [Kibdelosporangium aridum]|uniref:Anti-sigma factor antagonist n=1 Tax=Kibdelosporangium aridum TaxID=2030 RepID=A0A428ZIM7_KIBAR|nr:anti-sigma factor antagonist [Kibdelosporangium aridum]RSM87956.1 STAS domain-containing protein [Kibdelosporangium aridum]
MTDNQSGAEPSPARLAITQRIVDDTPLVVATGEVDMDTAPTLSAAVTTALDQAAGRPCILDLTAVSFLNSAGLTALVNATRQADARQEPLRIVVDSNRPVIRPIEITGLDTVLALYHSVDEALHASNESQ